VELASGSDRLVLSVALGQCTSLSPGARLAVIVAEPSSSPPVSTFIVRFWREWSPGQVRWRGRIEHMQSGENASCLDLESTLDFIQGLGVMADDLSQRGEMDV
jgi:hypothetical protein